MARRSIFNISHRQAGMIVDALHGRGRFGRKLRPKAKAQQKVAASKPSALPRVQPKPSVKEEEESAALIAAMVVGVFLLFVFGVRWEFLLGLIAVVGILTLLKKYTTKTVRLTKEQRLRYEWAVQNNFWGTASHDERTFLNNQTVTLERQYQEYIRQKMEQGFIDSETIKEQSIENVKEAKQNIWKKLDRIDMTFLSKTVIEFANELNVPVGQVWADLKELGISPTRDQLLIKAIQDHLSAIYQKASTERDKAEAIKLKRQEFKAKMLRQQEEFESIKLKRQEESNVWELKRQEEAEAIRLKQEEKEAITLKQQEEVKSDEIKPPLKEWQIIRLKRQEEAKANELMRQKKYEAIRLKQQEEIKTNELIQQQEPEDKARAEELRRLKEAKADKERQQNSDKLLKKLVISIESEARKIGQLLDLCCELIPAPIAKKIIANCRTLSFIKAKELPKGWLLTYQTLSDIFLSSFYWILKNDVYGIYLCTQKFKDYTLHTIPTLIRIPESIASDYSLNLHTEYSIEDYNNDINKHKKCNRYTAALVETIYFLLTNSEIKRSIIQSDSPFRNLHSVVELLIDMGAIDSALRLYKIDERICNTPTRLSLLANKSVQSGNLDDSIKLVGKLIEQEPYHPTIPAIQAEIKRLEQRHRLKATFSIDFSKVDELSGVEFENLLLDKFAAMGFKAESTPKTGDFGADLIVENKEGTRIIVQCKRFKSKVNLKSVQEVVGAMGHYAGDLGIVITNNSFLNSAVKLAESHDIELWDGDKLVSFLAGDLSFSQIFPKFK